MSEKKSDLTVSVSVGGGKGLLSQVDEILGQSDDSQAPPKPTPTRQQRPRPSGKGVRVTQKPEGPAVVKKTLPRATPAAESTDRSCSKPAPEEVVAPEVVQPQEQVLDDLQESVTISKVEEEAVPPNLGEQIYNDDLFNELIEFDEGQRIDDDIPLDDIVSDDVVKEIPHDSEPTTKQEAERQPKAVEKEVRPPAKTSKASVFLSLAALIAATGSLYLHVPQSGVNDHSLQVAGLRAEVSQLTHSNMELKALVAEQEMALAELSAKSTPQEQLAIMLNDTVDAKFGETMAKLQSDTQEAVDLANQAKVLSKGAETSVIQNSSDINAYQTKVNDRLDGVSGEVLAAAVELVSALEGKIESNYITDEEMAESLAIAGAQTSEALQVHLEKVVVGLNGESRKRMDALVSKLGKLIAEVKAGVTLNATLAENNRDNLNEIQANMSELRDLEYRLVKLESSVDVEELEMLSSQLTSLLNSIQQVINQ